MSEDRKKRRKTEEHLPTPANTGGPSDVVQYHCNYCRKDISNCVRICCAVCPEFDLCIECFSVGVELENHKNDHDFRIIDNMHFPFLSEDWGADEEQLLLEGLELYGYGNWEDVAEHVTTKTKKECEEHYVKYYLGDGTQPLPDLSRILSTRDDVIRRNATSQPRPSEGSVMGKLGAETKAKAGAKPPKPQQSLPIRHELANYMPLRGEFEIEWDNEAELSIKDIEFYDDDTKEERETKMKLLEIYNQRLDDREEKRRFVIERQLHDVKRMQAIGRKQSREEKELYAKTRKLSTFTTPEEYETFVKSLLLEKQLRQRIAELQQWRQQGIRSLQDGEAYKAMRARQLELEKANLRRTPGRPSFDKTRKPTRPDLPMEPMVPKPGYELLSDQERKLCSQLDITPDRYLQLKVAFIREYLTNGPFTKQQVKSVTSFDTGKAVKVFEFLEECGWINKVAQSQTQTSSANAPSDQHQQASSATAQPPPAAIKAQS